MSEQTPEDSAPAQGTATDIDAADLDVGNGAGGDTPATSDPDEYADDSSLGGTHGGSAGGAG